MKLPEWKNFNDYYEENPPDLTIDDTGIRHFNEVPLPAKYKKHPCNCGIIHHISDETWYHSTLKIAAASGLPHKVVKKCKKCQQILLLELIKEPPR